MISSMKDREVDRCLHSKRVMNILLRQWTTDGEDWLDFGQNCISNSLLYASIVASQQITLSQCSGQLTGRQVVIEPRFENLFDMLSAAGS